jgi:demethylmenaquinone methyltransferase/2-methoxy-6-polyprenyl-1,4-benzoquinol methylase
MKGLREMVRVLRPHGRLIILETGSPRHRLLRAGYQVFLFTFARVIGWILTGRAWPFTYLARSVRQFLTPQQFVDRLQSVPTQVQYVPLSYGLASLYLATKS